MSEVKTGLERAHEINRLRRESGEKIVIKTPLEKAAGKPDSLRLAINGKCYDCIGQDADPDWRGSIRECVCKDCPLYPVRPYQKKIDQE
jgi:hypothetical protein